MFDGLFYLIFLKNIIYFIINQNSNTTYLYLYYLLILK
jgi:hypothetical protein